MTATGSGASVDDEREEQRRLAPEAYELFCPDCGEPAGATVILFDPEPTHRCSECGTRWRGGDRENCARCGKSLGSTDTVCYTCRTELEGGSP